MNRFESFADRYGHWLGAVAMASALAVMVAESQAQSTLRFAGPTASQPLALSADDRFLVVANPDSNSVSFFDLRGDKNRKVAEVPVQKEPNGVAFMPNGRKAYVANTASGTVSVINVNIAGGAVGSASKHIKVGTEPYGLALTPNGSKLYVTNARSNTVSVIDTATDAVIKTIAVRAEPRGIAISNNGDANDADETVYVAHFLSFTFAGKVDGADDAKGGDVIAIAAGSDSVLGSALIRPLSDTGFNAVGDALARIPPGDVNDPASFRFPTGAYPNQLNNIALKGGFAFLPNTGASPNGPVRFDVNTQALVSVFDRGTLQDAGQTINLHQAIAAQTNPNRLFATMPWAMAFKHRSDEAFVVSAASNHLLKLAVNTGTGASQVQSDPSDPTRVLQIALGKNPRGIVINAKDTRAYVMNQISRDVSVINLSTAPETVMATLVSAAQPAPGSLAEKVHIGKELYNTSVGVFDPAPGTTTPITGRMSRNGWGACAACHSPWGLSDNVVWIFPPGPRRTIPQHTDFDQTVADRSVMRILNWSAERDEQEDFELNIRVVSGGAGLIVKADGVTPEDIAQIQNLTPLANANRNQLKVRGVGAWDAIKAFQQFGIRAPISPLPATDPDVVVGRAQFAAANCQSCHGGAQWTSGRVRFTPPPADSLLNNGQVFGELRNVGTFDPTFFNEVRQNAGAPLGALGFVPASLLSLHAFQDVFLHNGAAPSLDVVMNNVTHRSAGTGGVDTLSNAADRARVVKFMLSIDGTTTPFP